MFSNSSNQELFANPLTVLRNGAQALLGQAVEAEVQGRIHRRSIEKSTDFRSISAFEESCRRRGHALIGAHDPQDPPSRPARKAAFEASSAAAPRKFGDAV